MFFLLCTKTLYLQLKYCRKIISLHKYIKLTKFIAVEICSVYNVFKCYLRRTNIFIPVFTTLLANCNLLCSQVSAEIYIVLYLLMVSRKFFKNNIMYYRLSTLVVWLRSNTRTALTLCGCCRGFGSNSASIPQRKINSGRITIISNSH